MIDGLCATLDELADRAANAGIAYDAEVAALQLRELRRELWPTDISEQESYGAADEWAVDFAHIFREGVPREWDELCSEVVTARAFDAEHGVRCHLFPNHGDRHAGRVRVGIGTDHRDAEFFHWKTGDPVPLES